MHVHTSIGDHATNPPARRCRAYRAHTPPSRPPSYDDKRTFYTGLAHVYTVARSQLQRLAAELCVDPEISLKNSAAFEALWGRILRSPSGDDDMHLPRYPSSGMAAQVSFGLNRNASFLQ